MRAKDFVGVDGGTPWERHAPAWQWNRRLHIFRYEVEQDASVIQKNLGGLRLMGLYGIFQSKRYILWKKILLNVLVSQLRAV
jgi:hypothetical protein